MRRSILHLIAFLALTVICAAQTIVYNPTRLEFSAPPSDVVSIKITITPSGGMETIERTLDLTTVKEFDGGQAFVDFSWFPAMAVGTSYTVTTAVARDNDVYSDDAVAPEVFRVQPCVTSGGSVQAITVAWSGPITFDVDTYTLVDAGDLILTGPNPIKFIVVDLIADGQPALYYVVADGRAAATIPPTWGFGPFQQTGVFEMSVHVIDEKGCEGDLPGPRPSITISP